MLPTKLGDRLIGHHFDARLGALKHKQGRELGKLQAELDYFKDRGVRSNEREYQALSAIWDSFVDAFYKTKTSAASISVIPNFEAMTEEDITDILKNESFPCSRLGR